MNDKFVAVIFAFTIGDYLSQFIGAQFEMITSLVVIDLFGTEYASEVRSLGDSFNSMSREGRVIEAIGNTTANWISNPRDETFSKMVDIYRICRENA